MKLQSKISLAITTAVVISATAGCNGSDTNSGAVNAEPITPNSSNTKTVNLSKPEVTFDSKSMRVSSVKPDNASESSKNYQLPEVYPDLISTKSDEAKERLNKTLEIINKGNESKQAENPITALIHNPNYTPGCTELQINQQYLYRPNQGSQSCFYFDVPNDSRVEFFALQQTATRQVNILANHDVNANLSLSFVGETSDIDFDDNLRFWAEAGHYYMFLNDMASDNELIIIGAAVNEVTYHQESNGSTPSYVGNDTPGSAAVIQNGFAPLLKGTLDTALDIDHYRMHSFWGQDLAFQVLPGTNGVGNPEDVILEAFLNGQWTALATRDLHTLSGLPTYAEVVIRVRVSPGAPVGHIRYIVVAGSKPANIEDLTPDGDNGPKVPPSHSPWRRVQNEDVFSWSAKITDSTGNPVRGLYMGLHAKNNSWLETVTFDYGVDTDYQGVVSSSGSVNDCDGYMEHSYLNVRYNFGAYKIWAPFFEKFGLATINDTFLHICDDY